MPHSRVPDRIRAIQLPPFDPLNLRAAQLRADGHHVISLGQALPFFPPPRTALDGAREALAQADVHRYSTDPGLLSLRTTLAARLAADTGSTIDPEDLIITAGANHAFTLALTTLVDPGDEVIVPAPYFTNHQMAVCALGARAIEAPIADRTTFSLTWTDIEPHLTPRTRAVVLCTPSNPTGATIDRVTGARIVAECAARRLAVLSDETYAAFVFEGEPWSAASCDGWRDTVVVIGTFSKSFGMMGWRVGFLLADRRICEQATKVQDAMIICAPVISQMAVERAVQDSWHYAASFHDEFRRRRQLMRDGLAVITGLSWTPTRGGLFAFTRCDGCRDSTALARDLLETAKIVTIPGAAFGTAGEGHLRLSYGFASPADLAEALTRMQRFFG